MVKSLQFDNIEVDSICICVYICICICIFICISIWHYWGRRRPDNAPSSVVFLFHLPARIDWLTKRSRGMAPSIITMSRSYDVLVFSNFLQWNWDHWKGVKWKFTKGSRGIGSSIITMSQSHDGNPTTYWPIQNLLNESGKLKHGLKQVAQKWVKIGSLKMGRVKISLK